MKKPAAASRPSNGRTFLVEKLATLYEKDEVAWLEKSSRLIREERLDELDYRHLAEYLEDMAKSERREVKNRLAVLLAHLLKWQYQPRKRTRTWTATILTQRFELEDFLDSATLKRHALDVLQGAYEKAVKVAATETGLSKKDFPEECPFSLDFLLSDQFPESDITD